MTWIVCMCSLQTLNEESGDQLYRYYRFARAHTDRTYVLWYVWFEDISFLITRRPSLCQPILWLFRRIFHFLVTRFTVVVNKHQFCTEPIWLTSHTHTNQTASQQFHPLEVSYSLRSILPFVNIDIFRYILMLDIFVFMKGNIDQRE
jgi:hypothetical protein